MKWIAGQRMLVTLVTLVCCTSLDASANESSTPYIGNNSISVRPIVHELDDGVVLRAIQVTLRDRAAAVRYTIGLNDQTLADQFEVFTSEKPPGELATLLDQFRQHIGEQVAANLSFEAAGNRLKAIEVTAEQGAQHHQRFVVDLQFEIPESSEALDLQLSDNTFGQTAGSIKLALRVRGSAILLNSNVAPVIVRAKPVELPQQQPAGDDAEVEQTQVLETEIRAKVKFLK